MRVVGLGVPDRPAHGMMSDLQGPTGQVPRERPQAGRDLSSGQVP
jgi:hypothetical protein